MTSDAKGSPSQPTASPVTSPAAGVNFLNSEPVRKAAKNTAVFLGSAVPAYFANRFLHEISGGGSWLPKAAHNSLFLISIFVGVLVFNLVRTAPVRRRRRRNANAEAEAPRPAADNTKIDDHAAKEKKERAREHRKYQNAIFWAAIATVLVLMCAVLRWSSTHEWEPPVKWQQTYSLEQNGTKGLPSFIELEKEGSTFRGTILVPMEFLLSSGTREMLTIQRKAKGGNVLQQILDEQPDKIIDRLRDEDRFAVLLTAVTIGILHIAAMAAAGAAFGAAFTVSEEVGSAFATVH